MQNACSEMPCKHGGTCEEDGRGNYRCICPSGYSGKQCEKEQSKFAENEVTYLTYVIIRGLISSYTLGGRGGFMVKLYFSPLDQNQTIYFFLDT